MKFKEFLLDAFAKWQSKPEVEAPAAEAKAEVEEVKNEIEVEATAEATIEEKTEEKEVALAVEDAPAEDAPAEDPIEARVAAIEDAIQKIIARMDEMFSAANAPAEQAMSAVVELKKEVEKISASPSGEVIGKEKKTAKVESNHVGLAAILK